MNIGLVLQIVAVSKHRLPNSSVNTDALQAARHRQATQEFKTAYAARAGIEGTLSQGMRAFGLRQARYRGLEKVHLQQVLTATAFNVCRMYAWLTEQPRAQTRQAAFVRLVKKRA